MTHSPAKISCRLDLPAALARHNIGSLLHGNIMERLPPETAEKLHRYRYNPIKQRLALAGGAAVWEIVCLEGALAAELAGVFRGLRSIELKRHGAHVPVSDMRIEEIDLRGFVDGHMFCAGPRKLVRLAFLSPTSFKSGKDYDIFPDAKKLLRSVMLNFDYFSPATKLYDYEALDYFAGQTKITDYSLQSARFCLDGARIPSFKGKITIRLTGSDQTLRFLNLILSFGELCGVGIKTSLGMGHVRVAG